MLTAILLKSEFLIQFGLAPNGALLNIPRKYQYALGVSSNAHLLDTNLLRCIVGTRQISSTIVLARTTQRSKTIVITNKNKIRLLIRMRL